MSRERKISHIEGTLTKNCFAISCSQILKQSVTVHKVTDYRLHSQGSNADDPRLSIDCYAQKVTRARCLTFTKSGGAFPEHEVVY
jgi:hypothetical protein